MKNTHRRLEFLIVFDAFCAHLRAGRVPVRTPPPARHPHPRPEALVSGPRVGLRESRIPQSFHSYRPLIQPLCKIHTIQTIHYTLYTHNRFYRWFYTLQILIGFKEFLQPGLPSTLALVPRLGPGAWLMTPLDRSAPAPSRRPEPRRLRLEESQRVAKSTANAIVKR